MAKMVSAYISALWNDAVARMSGLASILFTFGGVYSDAFTGVSGVILARKFWVAAAVVCFIFANYKVWADEHQKLISQLPKFELIPEHVDWEYQPAGNETAIVLALTMLNSGAPSSARNWRAVLIVGQKRETLKSIQITDCWILPDPAKKNPVVFYAHDQISFKTVQGRIETGESVFGRSVFTTPGNREQFMQSLNWALEITCDDFRGNSFTGVFTPHPGAVLERKAFPGEVALTPELLAKLVESRNKA